MLAGQFGLRGRDGFLDLAGLLGFRRGHGLVEPARAFLAGGRHGFLEAAVVLGLRRGDRFLRSLGDLGLGGHAQFAHHRHALLGRRPGDLARHALQALGDLAGQLPGCGLDDVFDVLIECHALAFRARRGTLRIMPQGEAVQRFGETRPASEATGLTAA